jgi:hypothetical protein
VDRVVALDGLTLLGGPTGCGKSGLALQIVTCALKRHPRLAALVLMLDPGMCRPRIYERLLSRAAGVSVQALRDPQNLDPSGKVLAAGKTLRETVLPRLKVVDASMLEVEELLDGITITNLRFDLLYRTAAERVLVVIDYLNCLPVAEDIAPASLDADMYRLGTILEARRVTRSPAFPNGDPFLVVAEVTKGWRADGRLGLNHLLGSARLGYLADTVVMLEPALEADDLPTERVPVTLRVEKARDGVAGTSVPLLFDHARGAFAEPGPSLAVRPAPEPESTPGASRLDPLAGLE